MTDTSTAGARVDPRTIITEDALHVAPELLGLPLAEPWRRAVAIAIDGILVAILANAPGALLGIAAVGVMIRAATRRPSAGGALRRVTRAALLAWAAVIVFILVGDGWHRVERWADALSGETVRMTISADGDDPSAAGDQITMSGLDAVRTGAGVLAFRRSKDEAEARRHGEEIIASLRSNGLDDGDVRNVLSELADDSDDKPWLRAAADSLLAGVPVTDSADAASTEAREIALAPDPPPDPDPRDDSREDIGILAMLKAFANDLGLGFGWMGLYFTSTVALWKGRTPGKLLLGIRIIRLNGKPIGWWAAFERFGGYAAGFATGLLGFLQVFWDRNRQAIHDKISETAVIRV